MHHPLLTWSVHIWTTPVNTDVRHSCALECVSIFSGNLSVLLPLPPRTRGSRCPQYFQDRSTERIFSLTHWRRDSFSHPDSGDTDVKGLELCYNSERCQVRQNKTKGHRVSNRKKNPAGTAMNHMPMFSFFINEWFVTTVSWSMWQSRVRTWLGENNRAENNNNNKRTECIYQWTPTVQYILLNQIMRFFLFDSTPFVIMLCTLFVALLW